MILWDNCLVAVGVGTEVPVSPDLHINSLIPIKVEFYPIYTKSDHDKLLMFFEIEEKKVSCNINTSTGIITGQLMGHINFDTGLISDLRYYKPLRPGAEILFYYYYIVEDPK